MSRIKTEKQLAAAWRRAVYLSIALGASAAAFTSAIIVLQGALFGSELVRVLSLVFSDPATILVDWQDFSMFFLESLPVMSIVLFLAALFALLASLKYMAKNIAIVRSWQIVNSK
ncbi:MAG TPA: hypothetical protein VNG29_00240 [Candidatus Paceibacterota bacterium]|nr:hypothetical protein [Candidatus Paceibacterota bacterium]